MVEKESIFKSKSLISLGIGHDWSFESDYNKLNKTPIFCYDHSINYSSLRKHSIKSIGSYFFRLFKPKYLTRKKFFSNMVEEILLFRTYKKFFNNDIKHFNYKIGPGKNDVTLDNIIKNSNLIDPVFIKIDIEGSEYRILDELIKFQNTITGIVIEFHDFDLHIDNIIKFIENLNLELVHIHPQNPAPVNKENIPTQIEITFAKNPKKISNLVNFPHELDQPSNPSFQDIELVFENN